MGYRSIPPFNPGHAASMSNFIPSEAQNRRARKRSKQQARRKSERRYRRPGRTEACESIPIQPNLYYDFKHQCRLPITPDKNFAQRFGNDGWESESLRRNGQLEGPQLRLEGLGQAEKSQSTASRRIHSSNGILWSDPIRSSGSRHSCHSMSKADDDTDPDMTLGYTVTAPGPVRDVWTIQAPNLDLTDTQQYPVRPPRPPRTTVEP